MTKKVDKEQEKNVKKKKGMNLPNKITCVRLVISFAVLFILCMDWTAVGCKSNDWGTIPFKTEGLSIKMMVCGILFIIGSITDFLDGYIARKYNLVTDFGKVMDAIADKVLVNGVLILLAYEGAFSIIVPVIIITRDIVVDSIKMASGSKGKVVAASWPGKIKTILMMIGVSLEFFRNIPFQIFGLFIADYFVYAAVVMSVVSAVQYFLAYKDVIFSEM